MHKENLNMCRDYYRSLREPNLPRAAANIEGIRLPKGIRLYIRRKIAEMRRNDLPLTEINETKRNEISDFIEKKVKESISREELEMQFTAINSYEDKLEELLKQGYLERACLIKASMIKNPLKRIRRYDRLYRQAIDRGKRNHKSNS